MSHTNLHVMNNIFRNTIIALTIALSFSSCEKENLDNHVLTSEDSIYWFVDNVMNTWYYWNEDVVDLDYLAFQTPQNLMTAMMVPQDHWSFIDKMETVQSFFIEGEEFGYGFYLGRNIFNDLQVIISYNNSTAYEEGIRRGWKLLEMDDISIQEIKNFDSFFSTEPGTMKFKFLDENNLERTITLNKEQFALNAVFNEKTMDISGVKTGYFAFQSFLGYAQEELIDALSYFNAEAVEELIIDLRFNGGGYVSIAEEMANILVPSDKVGEVYYSIKHNNSKKILNYKYPFETHSLNLGLKRIFFITNEYSASASELVINGLEPHMNVIQIGGTTTGKPYSMYPFVFQDWLAYPVAAKSVNADGFGDYEDGLVPDKAVSDNFDYNWGDENDPAIAQAINYIRYGNFDNVAIRLKGTAKPSLPQAGNSFKRNLLILDK